VAIVPVIPGLDPTSLMPEDVGKIIQAL